MHNSPDGIIKDGLQAQLCQSRALGVLECVDILGARQPPRVRDGGHPLLGQLVDRLLVVPLIELGADEDDGDIGRMMGDFWVPLRACVRYA